MEKNPTEQKPKQMSFQCNICLNVWNNQITLLRHKRFAHKNSMKKSKCSFCSRKYSATALKRHELRCVTNNISNLLKTAQPPSGAALYYKESLKYARKQKKRKTKKTKKMVKRSSVK